MLSGASVALGVTGSIAAVRTVELAHELRRRGATVRAVMTPSARSIVHEWALEFATDATVVTELTGDVEHVDLCGPDGWADLLLIAPATANTLGKMAAAIDDTPVTTCATTALGSDCPVVVAPAMHEPMYDHPGVLDAIDRLESWGVRFVDPRIEEGKAKVATDDAIALAAARTTSERPLADEHVVVTAGSTVEPIDPVRLVGNRSSGRTGRAIARACHVRGAEVTLVHGMVGPRPVGADRGAGALPFELQQVETASEMREATLVAVEDADALVSAAAIADYTTDPADEKLASGTERTLDLEPTAKVLDAVREARPDLPIVGFKLETAAGDDDRLVAAARSLRDRLDCAFVVANDVAVMGDEETRALLVDDDVETVVGSKWELGATVADRLAGS